MPTPMTPTKRTLIPTRTTNQKRASIFQASPFPAARLSFTHVVVLLILTYLLLNCTYCFLGYFSNITERVRGRDAVYYYVYLPSILFDHDLDFSNNLRHIYGNDFRPDLSEKGRAINVWSIGPAVLWSPGFFLAHFATLLSNILFDTHFPANGYGPIYYTFVYFTNSLYILLGILFTATWLKQYFPPFIIFLSCFSLLTATALTAELCAFSTMSHAPSFAITSLFLLLWHKNGPHPATAVAAGLMILTRWQEFLLLFPLVALSAAKELALIKHSDNHPFTKWLISNLLFGVIICAIFAPQSYTWWAIYGKPLTVPQGPAFLSFAHLHLLASWFSSNHGLFTWHPILLFGIVGMVIACKQMPQLALPLSGAFLLESLLNAAASDWNASWSFGQRRLIGILALFAFGLAFLVRRMGKRGAITVCTSIILLAIWNQAFIYQYNHDLISHSTGLTFDEFVMDKFRLRRVHQAHQLAYYALSCLRSNNIRAFDIASKQAFGLSPNSIKVFSIYALSCFVCARYQERETIYAHWHEKDRNLLLPRWGLAEIMINEGKYEAAKEMFRITDSDSGASDTEKVICNKIQAGAKTIINREFYAEFNKYIEYLLHEY